MGVTGLWSLLEPAGKPVPLESLENKVLAVDVSIWLNQAVKGFRDRSGNAVPNAHILGLFHRICKLLFYKIRPIFVFDGQAPELKKETLRRRRMRTSKAGKQARIASAKILDNYIRSQAVASQLKRQTLAIDKVLQKGQDGLLDALHSRNKEQEKDLFQLPPMAVSELDNHLSDSEEDEERERLRSKFDLSDIHHLDVSSREFKKLPKELQYEILSELKERRKQNSWHKVSEMPKKAENFSGYQVDRLLKRSQLQKTLENVGKNLGQEHTTALDTQLFVGDVEGIKRAKAESKRIASDASGRHYLYISGLKAAQQQQQQSLDSYSSNEDSPDSDYDPSEALAEKMAASDEVSQDEILGLIKKQKGSGHRLESDGECEEDLLEPSASNWFSNRCGGMSNGSIVESAIPSTSKSVQLKVPVKVENTEVEVMSDSESSSSGSFESVKSSTEVIEEVGDDLFDDVFESEENHLKLLDILQGAQPAPEVMLNQQTGFFKPEWGGLPAKNEKAVPEDPYQDIQRSLQDRKLETTEDIFAQIAKNARREIIQPTKPVPSKILQPPQSNESESSSDEAIIDREEIANKMKKSDHLWLKIASKWASEDTIKTPSTSTYSGEHLDDKKQKTKNQKLELKDFEAERAFLLQEMKSSETIKPSTSKTLLRKPASKDFELENKFLLEEMKRSEKEERLLNIKSLDPSQKNSTKPQTSTNSDSAEDKSLLDSLGVELIKSSDYEKKVEKEEGLENTQEPESNVSYGSSAPGFVRVSTKSKNVVEIESKDQPSTEPDSVPDYQSLLEAQMVAEKLNNEESLLTKEELIALQNSLAKEQQTLIAERSHQDRLAATITDQMYSDCQELLQLFGLPWIVSPSEAEAQCAFLDVNGLSHGTITDDSDVWVFGGQKVYKNFFNQSKHCEQFMAADLSKHFGLSREKMILLAELTGSDYTDGVESVGPVTALEILAEFPGSGLDPLKKFKAWWEKFQTDISLPPGSKLKEKLVRLRLPESFPSEAVYVAYLNPVVDNSTERFTWAVPNLVAVRDFAADKFGWQWQKIDEMLKPVIKKLSMKITQERIDNFFMSERMILPEKGNYQSSKRVKEAIDKVLGKSPIKQAPKKRQRGVPSENQKAKRPKQEEKVAEPSSSNFKIPESPQTVLLGDSVEEPVVQLPGEEKEPSQEQVVNLVTPGLDPIDQIKKRTIEMLKTGSCMVRGKRKIDIEVELLGRPVKEPERKPEIVVQPPVNWKKIEEDKKLEAKQRAIEIFKKAQAKQKTTNKNLSKSGRSRKLKKNLGPDRIVLPNHELSESESD